jgi:hypothetical protein
MIRQMLWTSLLVGLLMALAAAAAQDKKPDPNEPADPVPPKPKITKLDEVVGRLTKIDLKKNSLTIQVTITKPDPKAQSQIQHLQSEMATASRITNPAARARRISDLQSQINSQASRVKQEHKDVTFTLGEDLDVRLKSPPVELDENGKRKKHTPEELKELKGPGHEWGYTGDPTQLQSGQSIKVYLGRKKLDKGQDKKTADTTPFVYKIHVYSEIVKK